MGFLSEMFSERREADPKWNDLWHGSLTPFGAMNMSNAGAMVTNDTAMRCAAVYSCVRILAESIASLPIHLYRRLPGGGKERATDHWAYDLVHRAPHPLMSAYQWKEMLVYHMALTGNYYAEKVTSNANTVSAMTPWMPDRTKIKQLQSGMIEYEYTEPGGAPRFRTSPQMVHVPGMAWDGVRGLSPISYARETIGLAIAAEEFGSRLFGSGTNPGHIFTLPEGVRHGPEEADKFSEDLLAKHAGLGKSHSGMVIPAGMTFERIGIPPNDAQFLETRKFQVQEIARIYRVPLHLIQMEEKDSSWGTGIESLGTAFIIHTLGPWMARIEQTLNRSLLAETEQREYFFEFLADALKRGDSKARSEFYAVLLQNQVMTPNEVREKENMNPIEGGDEVIKPENLFGKSQDAPTDETDDIEKKSECICGHEHRAEPDPDLDHPRMSIQRAHRRLIRDAMGRVIRRERNDIMAGAKKALRKRSAKVTKGEKRNTDSLAEFIGDFYTDHEEFTREQITPAFEALAEAIGAEAMREIEQAWAWDDELRIWLNDYVNAFANRHSNQSRGQLLQLLDELEDDQGIDVDDAAILDALGERFEEWETGLDGALPREGKISAREATRLGNGFAAAAFFAAGVAAMVWRNTGSETCPYCTGLNGERVGPSDFFVAAGAAFAPGGAEPLRPRSGISHPPLHAGCDCIVIPGG